jgi:hypothetical protein
MRVETTNVGLALLRRQSSMALIGGTEIAVARPYGVGRLLQG